MTTIEWTQVTWNPTTGCDRVSAGCDNCYALTMAKRLKGMGSAKYQTDGDPRTSGPGFGIAEHADALTLPLTWRKPRKVFVNSMSDLFHAGVSDEFIARVFAVMAATPQHTYQILTKRHGRMRSLLSSHTFRKLVADALYVPGEVSPRGLVDWPLPSVWLGVSVEDQQRADLRIPALLGTPAAVRFLSCEPLLGPLDLNRVASAHRDMVFDVVGKRYGVPGQWQAAAWPGIDWVIVGGESGSGARPMHPEWARTLRDQCAAAEVPFFFKQWGRWAPEPVGNGGWRNVTPAGEWINYDRHASDGSVPMAPTFKAPLTLDGRALDGRTWSEYPAVPA